MLYAIFVAFAVTTTTIAVPVAPQWSDDKCVPRQYEAVALGKLAQDVKGQGEILDVVASFAADHNIGKDVFIELLFAEGKLVGNYTYLRAQSADYLIDTLNRKCYMLPATKVEQLCSNSPSLHYQSSMTVGDQIVDTYKYEVGGAQHTGTFLRSSFTRIYGVVEQTFAGIPQMFAFQLGNYTMGVKDPNVFDVPSYC